MHRSFIFLAEGFEEIEALTVIDVMRRAGMDIKSVSITDSKLVAGAHGITVETDLTFKEADFADSEWLICPGGMPGASNLHSFNALSDLLRVHKGKIAAICAAPTVLGQLGLLQGRQAVCYPGMEDGLTGASVPAGERVVVDGTVITGQAAGSSLDFGLTLIETLLGRDKAEEVRQGVCYR